MDPYTDSLTLEAFATARRLLRDAASDTLALGNRADALADATNWQSRATDAYRVGVAELVERLRALGRLISVVDGDVALAQDELAWRTKARV